MNARTALLVGPLVFALVTLYALFEAWNRAPFGVAVASLSVWTLPWILFFCFRKRSAMFLNLALILMVLLTFGMLISMNKMRYEGLPLSASCAGAVSLLVTLCAYLKNGRSLC